MKKILTMCMALALVLAMAVPAYAYDGSSAARSSTSWWDWWSYFIPSNPSVPSDPTEPSVPEATELGVTTITESRYYHSASVASLKNRLQIQWKAVDGAECYEIEVVKADGTVLTCTASTNSLMVKNTACPKGVCGIHQHLDRRYRSCPRCRR